MLAQRIRVAIVILIITVGVAIIGGWLFRLFMVGMVCCAGWEFWRLFRQGSFQPSLLIMISGIATTMLVQATVGPEGTVAALCLIVMAAMVYHLIAYQAGNDKSANDFCITVGGVLYLGLLGSFFILLRELPDGLWWILLVVPSIAMADSGAYFIGTRFGKHRMANRISPKKSWEGYFGGILIGTLGTYLLSLLWTGIAPAITPGKGLVVGMIMSIITPLGDLGESMLKRQFGVKDSSQILPGHGGILDRIDSWLWSVVLGYYLIVWFFL